MPHERPVAKQRAVLLEELIPQPVGDVLLLAASLSKEFLCLRRRPGLTECDGQELLQAVSCRRLSRNRRKANDAVGIGEQVEVVRVRLLGPPVTDESRNSDLQGRSGHLRRSLEEPLCRIVRPRLGYADPPSSATVRHRLISKGTCVSVATRRLSSLWSNHTDSCSQTRAKTQNARRSRQDHARSLGIRAATLLVVEISQNICVA